MPLKDKFERAKWETRRKNMAMLKESDSVVVE